jgi:hypothetical protein
MTIPLWVFILVVGVMAVVIMALWRNELPFPDRGSFIYTARDAESRNALIELLRIHGQEPAFRADDSGGQISRAIYKNGLILNVVQPDTLSELGDAGGGFAIVASDPMGSALEAVTFLSTRGDYTAKVHGPYEDGNVVIVTTPMLQSGVIVFRKHLIKMGKPPKWTDDPIYSEE